MRKKLTVSGLAIIGVLVFCAFMIRNAAAPPVQRNVTIEMSGLAGSRPLRIVLLGDMHVAKYGDSPERLRETVSRVADLHPDLVLLAGDFLADAILEPVPMRPNVAPLEGLEAPLGVFAVLGNHDYLGGNPERLRFWLSRVGVRVLDNEAVRAGPLTVVGISDDFSGHARLRPALLSAKRAGGTPIVLTHSPDIIPDLPQNFELALAGHTHCGQVVLPLIGSFDTRSRFGLRYACGLVREGARTTVVTGGLGVSRLPFRLGAPPDFWVITVLPRRAR